MIIIGERINATRKKIAEAIEKKDAEFIREEAEKQIRCGADFIDLNAGTGKGKEREKEDLKWLIEIVQEKEKIPISLDSSDIEIIGDCLPHIKSEKKIINSINGEEEKLKKSIPIIKEYPDCKIIVLTMDDEGIPENVEKRIEISKKLVDILKSSGVKEENIFIDPLVQPVSVNFENGIVFLQALKKIKELFPGVKTTCGLSNISFGLPNRKLLNKYFLAISMGAGLDSAIVDPVDPGIREAICVSNALTGKDEFCMNYIKEFKSSRLNFGT